MKKTIIAALFVLAYCSSRHENNYDPAELKKIEQFVTISPPPPIVTFTPVYIISIDDSISQTNFANLNTVYEGFYKGKYPTFSDFLFDALNQKIKLDTKSPETHFYFSQKFINDQNISHQYSQGGIREIINKYCMDSNGVYLLKKDNLTLNEINTISYYFFINQYIRLNDDYHAEINFKKFSS